MAADTRFSVATRQDDADIRRLLREGVMGGNVRLTLEREPDYFAGANLGGARDTTIVAREEGRLVCIGRCSTRDCWLNGHIARVGYLAELRLDASARGRFGILRDGYRFFRQVQGDHPAALYFTSIGAANARARRLLERERRALPDYIPIGELETRVFAVQRRCLQPRLQLEVARPEHLPQILQLLAEHGQRHPLAAAWNPQSLLALERHGLPLERFVLAFDGQSLAACGALWDQRAFRQTVIRGYTDPLAGLSDVWNIFADALDRMPIPPPGAALSQAFVSPLAFAEGAEGLLPIFLDALFPAARNIGVEFLTLALPADDARLASLRRFPHRSWRSLLYRVDWPGACAVEIEGPVLPDIALL